MQRFVFFCHFTKNGGCILVDMYERLKTVAKEKGTSIWRVLDDLHISRGIMSALKSGKSQQLTQRTLQKIADRLGVSIDYLINGQNDYVEPNNGEIDEFAYALYNEAKQMTDEQKALLLQLAKQMNTKG